MALTKERRAALPNEAFAVPSRRVLPIHDAPHVRMSWGQVVRAAGLSDEQRVEARQRILAAAEQMGIDLSSSVASMQLDTPLSAMALAVPEVDDHPNRLPFSGVLTRLDEASDKAPHGSKGRKVILRAAAAEKALGSLLGMGVNYVASQDGHDVKKKVGVITGADIRDGAVHIDGIIYASDFPEEAARIQSDKDHLGFSWELANIFVASLDADPLDITDCVFTGAAILRKDKAAYATTSLSAAAEEIDMTKEEIAAMFAEGLKPLTDKINALETGQTAISEQMQASAAVRAKVEPFASKLDEMADQMEGEGVGTDERSGHVKVLRAMSASMRADAANGRVPASYYSGMYAGADAGAGKDTPDLAAAVAAATEPLKAQIASLTTKLDDKMLAARDGTKEPERKTLSPAITALLAKADVTMPEGDGKLAVSKLDAALTAAGIAPSERLRVKASLAQAGRLDR